MPFNITDFVEFDARDHARCPSCDPEGKRRKSLAIVPNTSGAYKCFRGCTPQQIRDALGQSKPSVIPTPPPPAKAIKSITINPQKVKECNEALLQRSKLAIEWLARRGITAEMAEYYRIGITRAKCGAKHLPAITIPIAADREGTAFYQKKRVAPWLPKSEQPPEYSPWSQYGIPPMIYWGHYSDRAASTWLVEGEWDAMMLGWLLKDQEAVAVASFTCGAGTVPPAEVLAALPGNVVIFYDLDEPGRRGAEKVARAIGARARVAIVPEPPEYEPGWDCSNAIQYGNDLRDFYAAAADAAAPAAEPAPAKNNSLAERLITHKQLMERAPDYTDWIVPDLLTANEMFLFAAPPRAGKTLFVMTLAKAVASGGKFLGRPCSQGNVLFVRCEDGEAKTKERAINQGWPEDAPVFWLDKFKLSQLEELKELIEMHSIKLLILDTLSRIKEGSINENSAEMSQYLEPIQDMCLEQDVCTILIHHTTKINADNADTIDVFDTARGSGAIRGVCRGSLILAPGRECYRLFAENGWGKHDLQVVLDGNSQQWHLIGNWAGKDVDLSQKDRVLHFLTQVGSASIEQIAEHTNLPKRSLYVVLERLQSEDLIEKHGARRGALYVKSSIQQIQQLNSLLNSSSVVPVSVSGDIQQNKKSLEDSGKVINYSQRSSDQQIDHPQNDETGSQSGFGTFAKNDHLFSGGQAVELGDQIASNPDPDSISTIQQKVNTNSTVDFEAKVLALEPGTKIKVLEDGKWRNAKYIGAHSNSRLSPISHSLETAIRADVIRTGRRIIATIDCVELPEDS